MNEAERYKELGVLGKRRPEFVMPYVELLKSMAETDENRVVRIHCLGAVRAAES